MSKDAITIEELSAYIDGEVTEQERERIRRAIENDAETRDLYQQLKSTATLFASLTPLEAPPRLKHKVTDSIHKRTTGSPLRRLLDAFSPGFNFSPGLMAAAATVLIIIIGVYYISTLPLNQAQPETADAGENETMLLADAQTEEEEAAGGNDFNKSSPAAPAARNRRTVTAPGESVEQPLAEAMPQRERDATAFDNPAAGTSLEDVSGPMYRAEILDTYYEPGTDVIELAADRPEAEYRRTWGREMIFNPEASLGSDENPVVQNSEQLPPDMPDFDFMAHGPEMHSSILLQGVVHVSSRGNVLYYRLTGPPGARRVIDSFALRLESEQLTPGTHHGKPASVLYRFIAMIYPAHQFAE